MRAILRLLAGILFLQLAGAPWAFAGQVVHIKIKDMAFAPAGNKARIGDTIEWVNDDIVDHTATAKSNAWDVLIPVGKSVQLPLIEAGTFDYFCRFHPNMTGMIRVSTD